MSTPRGRGPITPEELQKQKLKKAADKAKPSADTKDVAKDAAKQIQARRGYLAEEENEEAGFGAADKEQTKEERIRDLKNKIAKYSNTENLSVTKKSEYARILRNLKDELEKLEPAKAEQAEVKKPAAPTSQQAPVGGLSLKDKMAIAAKKQSSASRGTDDAEFEDTEEKLAGEVPVDKPVARSPLSAPSTNTDYRSSTKAKALRPEDMIANRKAAAKPEEGKPKTVGISSERKSEAKAALTNLFQSRSAAAKPQGKENQPPKADEIVGIDAKRKQEAKSALGTLMQKRGAAAQPSGPDTVKAPDTETRTAQDRAREKEQQEAEARRELEQRTLQQQRQEQMARQQAAEAKAREEAESRLRSEAQSRDRADTERKSREAEARDVAARQIVEGARRVREKEEQGTAAFNDKSVQLFKAALDMEKQIKAQLEVTQDPKVRIELFTLLEGAIVARFETQFFIQLETLKQIQRELMAEARQSNDPDAVARAHNEAELQIDELHTQNHHQKQQELQQLRTAKNREAELAKREGAGRVQPESDEERRLRLAIDKLDKQIDRSQAEINEIEAADARENKARSEVKNVKGKNAKSSFAFPSWPDQQPRSRSLPTSDRSAGIGIGAQVRKGSLQDQRGPAAKAKTPTSGRDKPKAGDHKPNKFKPK